MALLLLIAAWRNPKAPGLGQGTWFASHEALLAHLALYGVLGVLTSFDVCYWKGRRRWPLGLALASLAGLAWGTATESYQLVVPGRDADILDVLIDVLGATSGGLLAMAFYTKVKLPALHS